jgi:hypothetical protein
VLTLNRNHDNAAVIEAFFEKYVMGLNQTVLIRGPYNGLVIDDIMEQNVTTLGSPNANTAFGGAITKTSLLGWDIKPSNGDSAVDAHHHSKSNFTDDELLELGPLKALFGNASANHVRGAYTDMQNLLNVPIRITELEGTLYSLVPLRYKVTLAAVDTYDCYPHSTYELSGVRLGPGIWKDNSTKTWVDIGPNERITYFAIAEPSPSLQSKHDKDLCDRMFGFNCCWATITTAAICNSNRQLQKDLDAQLTIDYIPTQLKARITMLIDHNFELSLYYQQDFFPLYFGYEIYAGFPGDVGLKCADFEFY